MISAPVAGERGHLAVVEEDDVARVREQRGDVAGAEHLAVADAEDERRLSSFATTISSGESPPTTAIA